MLPQTRFEPLHIRPPRESAKALAGLAGASLAPNGITLKEVGTLMQWDRITVSRKLHDLQYVERKLGWGIEVKPPTANERSSRVQSRCVLLRDWLHSKDGKRASQPLAEQPPREYALALGTTLTSLLTPQGILIKDLTALLERNEKNVRHLLHDLRYVIHRFGWDIVRRRPSTVEPYVRLQARHVLLATRNLDTLPLAQ